MRLFLTQRESNESTHPHTSIHVFVTSREQWGLQRERAKIHRANRAESEGGCGGGWVTFVIQSSKLSSWLTLLSCLSLHLKYGSHCPVHSLDSESVTQSHPDRRVNRTVLTITRVAKKRERKERKKRREKRKRELVGRVNEPMVRLYLYIAPTVSAVVTLTGHKYTMRATLAFASHSFFFL